jgi:predicted nuclease of predicted toxin-antitoxin system
LAVRTLSIPRSSPSPRRITTFYLPTTYLDFGAILASSLGVSPSVVQIRALNLDPDAVMAKVVDAIEKVAEDLKTGALVIVQPGSTRARILPIKARPL